MFATAGRSIKMGLTACDIVSKWTWAATLLQSSNVAYAYGISGPFWYASGASIQILLFAVLAVEIKRREFIPPFPFSPLLQLITFQAAPMSTRCPS